MHLSATIANLAGEEREGSISQHSFDDIFRHYRFFRLFLFRVCVQVWHKQTPFHSRETNGPYSPSEAMRRASWEPSIGRGWIPRPVTVPLRHCWEKAFWKSLGG